MNQRITTADTRARTMLALLLMAVAGTVGFLLADSPAHSSTGSNSAMGTSGTVSLRKTSLGMILVNSRGRTLYLFAKDRGGKSSCTGSCATFWPPLLSATKPTAGSGVKAALIGRTRRSNGTMQVTYNKHPLYTFAFDKTAGQVTGEGLLKFGAKWWGVSAGGTAVTKTAPTGTTTTTVPTYTYPTYP
jgi:predicted lipoprotein with Yx(FWY)xxD motif